MQIDFGEGEIDFGNDIDFGENVTLDEGGDIDWGEDPGAGNEIDFNISLEDSGIKVEGSGLAGGVAKSDQALTILDSPSYREQFLDELLEVLRNVTFPGTKWFSNIRFSCSWKRSSKCVCSN